MGEALVVAGHGSHRNPDSSLPVREHVRRLRALDAFDEVRGAFWKEEPAFHEVLRTLESDVAYVVPLFVSEGYFTEQVLPRELAHGESTLDGACEVRRTRPVGTHERTTDVVRARVDRALAGVTLEGDVGLAVVGHGTDRNPTSADAVYDHADRLREDDRFAQVEALFMDEAPYVSAATDRFETREVVVVPLFVADGFHTQEEIPALLGLCADPGEDYPVPGEVEGHRVWYTPAVGTEPELAEVVLERAAEAGADVPEGARVADAGSDARPAPTEGDALGGGPTTTAAEAFIASLDRTGERGLEWGQLVVRARDGGYEVRHRADADRAPAALVDREPRDVDALARFDAEGRYRPLSGARTLRRGWILRTLDRTELLAALERLYPGAMDARADEREGRFDVTGFGETAARQTGLYEVVRELDPDQLAAATDAVCGDCVRRRAWDEDGTRVDGDAGDGTGRERPEGADGEIPCREACSFFVAAAREFQLEEAGETAPAAGTADPAVRPGELDDTGNRYRVRYRRARETDLPNPSQ